MIEPMELDPETNPSPYGAEAEPPLDEAQEMLVESDEIATYLVTDWKPSGLDQKAATVETKELSDADKADLARENEKIRANVATIGAVPHPFEVAEWTHPNGHPRCALCGGEERVGGACLGDMVPTSEGARSPSRPKGVEEGELKGDASGHPFHGNRYTGGIGDGPLSVAKIQAAGSSLKPQQIAKILESFAAADAAGGKPPSRDTSMTDRHSEYGNLRGDQAVALASYQRSGYGMMNDRLRAGSPPIMNEYTGERLLEEEQWRDGQIKAIDEAMEPFKSETTLYRAIGEGGLEALLGPPPDRGPGLGPERLPSGQDLHDRLASLVGSVMEDKAYCSTTTDKVVAGTRTHHSEVLVQMDVTPGVGYIDMNAHHLNDESYAHEKEVLLARGGKYEITGVSDQPSADFGTEYPVYVLHMRRAA